MDLGPQGEEGAKKEGKNNKSALCGLVFASVDVTEVAGVIGIGTGAFLNNPSPPRKNVPATQVVRQPKKVPAESARADYPPRNQNQRIRLQWTQQPIRGENHTSATYPRDGGRATPIRKASLSGWSIMARAAGTASGSRNLGIRSVGRRGPWNTIRCKRSGTIRGVGGLIDADANAPVHDPFAGRLSAFQLFEDGRGG